MRGARTLARRYARALLELAVEGGSSPEALRSELEQVRDVTAGQVELADVLRRPTVSDEAKKKILRGVFGPAALSPLAARLLEILAERGRLAILGDVVESFVDLWNARRGVTRAEAITAVELSAQQKQALTAALRSLAGLEVELQTRVDAALLGGVVVNMKGQTYDGSVQGRLRALRRTLVEG
jgi:F-type H+-transporting ATPase subunit delta